MSEMEKCPQCGQGRDEGYLAVEAPVSFRVLFFSITKIVRLLYSSRCGFLKISAV